MVIIGGMFNNAVVYADAFDQEEVNEKEASNENCHTMTNEWFGSEIETFLTSEEQEVSKTDSVLSEYFSGREQDYAGISLLNVADECSVQSEEVRAESLQCEIGITEFQRNAEILITDAEIATLYGKDDNVAQLHEYINANVSANGTVYIVGGVGALTDETVVNVFNLESEQEIK